METDQVNKSLVKGTFPIYLLYHVLSSSVIEQICHGIKGWYQRYHLPLCCPSLSNFQAANSTFAGPATNLLSILCVLTEILSHAHAKKGGLKDFKFGTFNGHFPSDVPAVKGLSSNSDCGAVHPIKTQL